MTKNRLFQIALCLLLVSGCTDDSTTGDSADDETDSGEVTGSVDSTGCVAVDLSNKSSSLSSVTISEESGVLTAKVKDSSLCVHMTGSYSGTVKIKNPNNADLKVIMDNVSITGQLKLNSSSLCAGNTYTLNLVGSSSIVGLAEEDYKKVLKSESNLVINGDGSLDITAKYKTGIGVDDVLTIDGGTVNITVDRSSISSSIQEKGFGIKAVNGFIMNDGSLDITARDNITYYESRGIKVDGFDAADSSDDDYDSWNIDACKGYGTGKGYIKVNGGKIVVNSDAKGMQAGFDADDDAVTSSTSDDPKADVYISGGSVNITTYTTPRDSSGGAGGPGSSSSSSSDTDVAPEGIEGKNGVYISGGEVTVVATDDGINAANALELSGGKVTVLSTNNDGLDSNGSFVISGDVLLAAFGANGAETGLDVIEGGTIQFKGGTVFGIGGSADGSPSASSGSFVTASIGSSGSGGPGGGGSSSLAGTTIALTGSSDTTAIAAVKVPSSYVGGGNLVFMSSSLSSGSQYNVYYSDASVTPDSNSSWFNDIILDTSGTVSGNTSTTVTAGQSSGNSGFGGGGTPGGGGPGH